jgi:hypothetical protein
VPEAEDTGYECTAHTQNLPGRLAQQEKASEPYWLLKDVGYSAEKAGALSQHLVYTPYESRSSE